MLTSGGIDLVYSVQEAVIEVLLEDSAVRSTWGQCNAVGLSTGDGNNYTYAYMTFGGQLDETICRRNSSNYRLYRRRNVDASSTTRRPAG